MRKLNHINSWAGWLMVCFLSASFFSGSLDSLTPYHHTDSPVISHEHHSNASKAFTRVVVEEKEEKNNSREHFSFCFPGESLSPVVIASYSTYAGIHSFSGEASFHIPLYLANRILRI